MKLSIIIPYYNTENYTNELLEGLFPQLNEETEVIIIDDGSDKPYKAPFNLKVIRKDNGGVSSARNLGLKKAKGEYIAFIDSDDLVSSDYIEKIFQAMETQPDTIYLSWKSMHSKWGKVLKDDSDEFGTANRCVWNRVFKKTYIKGLKFNESMQIAEDDDFLNKLPKANSKKCITSVVYHYRQNREGGLTNRKAKGEFEEPDIITQVVFYYTWIQEIGGVETFFFNFCQKMSEFYDIAILYDRFESAQIQRLRRLVPCYHNGDHKIKCDTLIINGIFDKLPPKVIAKRKIRLVHTCKIPKYNILSVPNDCDEKIFVSEASRNSFNESGTVISNMPGEIESKKALVLLSATRLTEEKGFNRMLKLAEKLKLYQIPFIWLVFTAHNDRKFPDGFVKLPPTLDIKPYIAKVDYLVQLSDIEAFCYSLQEALQLKVPVLTTPFEAIKEVGVIDGENGYILPFDIEELTEKDILKISNKIPKVKKYEDKTEKIIEEWKKVLGDSVPTHSYTYDSTKVTIRCKVRFNDLALNRKFSPGEYQIVDFERAEYLVKTLKAWEYV